MAKKKANSSIPFFFCRIQAAVMPRPSLHAHTHTHTHTHNPHTHAHTATHTATHTHTHKPLKHLIMSAFSFPILAVLNICQLLEHSGLPAWMFLAAGEGHASQGGGDLESEGGGGAMAVVARVRGCSNSCGVGGESLCSLFSRFSLSIASFLERSIPF
jgi:hypothetical protein